jgi:uncharacterized protein (UPF0210 family)
LDLAQLLEPRAEERGYEYISLGPALPEFPGSFKVIPEVLGVTENVFLCGVMASRVGGISLSALRACARVIQRAAPLEANGFANLRFAALANVPPGAPFFPAAYHSGGPPTFALATEAADLAVEAFSGTSSLGEARRSLVRTVENHARSISQESADLAERFNLPFGGIDFSMAPFPKEPLSIGTALECLGVPAVGMHGSLAAAAVVTDALERADFPRAGFSGLFLPMMEDVVLTKRAQEGLLTLEDVLLYSAVCGTGLDTIPLPGDISPEAMSAVLLDLSALALRLDKPLTARLMPIPGKAAGDPTEFDFSFFANGRVMAIKSKPLKGLLAGEEMIELAPTQRRARR